jgi:hypothetical protein
MKTNKSLRGVIFLAIFSINCEGNSNLSQQAQPIDSIKIVNRTPIRYNKNDTTIKDANNINRITDQLHRMTKTSNANLKASRGYYELILFYKNGKKEDLGIIYTIYNGIIITNDNDNTEFKNDALEQMMWEFFK